MEKWSKFLIRVLSYSNEEDIAQVFPFYSSKIYNMFLSKKQQSYFFTHMCNYKEAFPISNQLNILVGWNLSFATSLKGSYIKMVG